MKEESRINLNTFGMIYFSLFFIAIVFNESNPYLKFPKLDEHFLKTMCFDSLIGVGVGLAVVGISWVLSKKNKAFQELLEKFQSLLGPLSLTEIFFIAVFSSLAEEFFFRGLVQAKLGIVFASLLFGGLHTGPGKKYIPWTIFAVVMGFILGGLYEWSGNLMLPVVVHFVVNFLNLFLMQKNLPAQKA